MSYSRLKRPYSANIHSSQGRHFKLFFYHRFETTIALFAECADGYYNATCSAECGHCKNGPCNKDAGYCPNDCKENYMMPLCQGYLKTCNIVNGHLTVYIKGPL